MVVCEYSEKCGRFAKIKNISFIDIFRCKFPCSSLCPPCTDVCILECNHSKCKKKCGEPCIDCKVISIKFHLFFAVDNFLIKIDSSNYRNLVSGVAGIQSVRRSALKFAIGARVMNVVRKKSIVAMTALVVAENPVLHSVVFAIRTRCKKFSLAMKMKTMLGKS